MAFNGPNWAKMHQEKTFTFWTPMLALCAWFYGWGIMFRSWAYRIGLFKGKRLPGFVVSIGNLTTGGTGKTPAAVMIAKWAQKEGFRVAVLSRGYGGRYKDKVLVVSDGVHSMSDSQLTGDEPLLLAKTLTGVPVILAKKRIHAGLYARENYGTNFFILDDGFQHLELMRDMDLMLIDAGNPIGNGRLLPLGPMREPLERLKRSDAIILTRSEGKGKAAIEKSLRKSFPSVPIFHANHVVEKLVFPHTGKVEPPGFLRGKRVLGFAGIAQPDRLRETLISLGADVVSFKAFTDHHRFSPNEIEALRQMKEEIYADLLITTEKDWMRLAALNPRCPEMAYLCIMFKLLPPPNDFFKMLKDEIRERNQTS